MSRSQLGLYEEKFPKIIKQTIFSTLPLVEQEFIRKKAFQFRFTLQDVRQLSDWTKDLVMWEELSLSDCWLAENGQANKSEKKRLLKAIEIRWLSLKTAPNHYVKHNGMTKKRPITISVTQHKENLGLGRCPVASPKTRCCNLMTLDAVDNCGFDCSYCSIQSFYDGNKVRFDTGFAEKLDSLTFDPDKLYHVGTGQSSDSLMWGNSHGVLDAVLNFAHKHPNVILETKTKSANVAHLLKQDLPKNLLCTWSLNTPTLIANEEQGTASLDKRLEAARKMADKGVLVGFHFHPMIHYDTWREDYAEVFERIQSMFSTDEVALISLGTLTYIKPVIKTIRERNMHSKILKMPLIESDGKLTYPDEIKLDMFKHAFDSFNAAWQSEVFYYLCMENQRYWKPVFGMEYTDNAEFENAMKSSYMNKMNRLTVS